MWRNGVEVSSFARFHSMSRFPEDYVREELEVDEYRQLEQTLDGFGADQGEDAQYLDSLLAPENVEAGPSSSRRRGKVFEHLVREVTPIVMGLRAPSATTNPRKNRSRKAEAVVEESSNETCFSHGHGKSVSTLKSLKKMFTQCQLSADVEFLVPEVHERPSDCPDGYICVYEPYFTECGLWFPLPEFLTSYCSRRNIAFSQLSVASIRNAVGLVIMAAEENIVVNLNLFEEVTTFSIGQKNPGIVCASSRRRFKIVYGAKKKTNDWRKRYFFVKLNEASVEDIHLSCDNVWKMDPGSS
ncbi:meiosis-specific protein ASY2-like [Arabidopsis lyrata subsp. lyrata]|uniref:meiosis-specific protein ASY2-like n=1 Tax=Arabidopsis lyrata subsp. lyrata TaxID=81972 RepID=UPI000A29B9EC|nr:meiosis-specific protein ASY2-like [Arabidopsis lyrata subsp. lyrata]|eukprot:XP_020888565.1 meiosis-specific protein ASY2-like [Arabidopsis lyrata subsp. lyrata]